MKEKNDRELEMFKRWYEKIHHKARKKASEKKKPVKSNGEWERERRGIMVLKMEQQQQ